MINKSMVHKPKPIILCGDFETSTAGTEYAKKYDDTFVYALHVIRVPLADIVMKKDKVVSKTPWTPLKFVRWNYKPNILNKSFGTWDDFVSYVLNKMDLVKDFQIILYFHNGQKFDFKFIYKWLLKNNWYRALTIQDEEDIRETHQNYYIWERTESWNSGRLYFWLEKLNGYICVDLRDTLKIQQGTIEEIGNDLMKMYPDWKDNPWFKDFNLHKVKEFNNVLDYVQDLSGDNVVCKDGTTFNIHNPKQWPDVLKRRVSGDTEIMVVLLYYYILNQIINPVDYHADICLTTGSVAVKSLFEFIWTHYPDHPRNPKKLWDWYFGQALVDRQTDFIKLIGKWGEAKMDNPSIMRGGFCNGLDSLKGQVIEGYFSSYDVNSEYPTALTHPVPYGKPLHEESWNKVMKDNKLWGVIWVRAKSLKQKIRNIPARIPTAFELVEDEEIGHYTYEAKDFYGCFTKDEWVDFSNPNYFEWEEPELVYYQYYETRPLLRDFILDQYQVKCEAKKNANKSMYLRSKLIMNGIGGKMGQKLFKFHKIDPSSITFQHLVKQLDYFKGLDLDWKEDIMESSYKYDSAKKSSYNLQLPQMSDVPYVSPSIYACMTGWGRAWIFGAMLRIGAKFGDKVKVLYGDTDSMKIWFADQETQKTVDDYLRSKNLVDDVKLGCFKEEFNNQVKQFKYICPKKYFTSDGTNKVLEDKSALSGMRWADVHKVIEHPELKDFYIGAKFPVLKPRETKSGVLLEENLLEIKE